MLDQYSAVKAYQRRWRTKEGEYAFGSVEELIKFTASQVLDCTMTYKKIAEAAGCSTSTVSNLAKGETRFPRAATVFEILRVIGFSVVIRR